jgi:DNA modification methylase
MQYKSVPNTENVLVFRKRSTLLIDWFIRNHHSPEIVQSSKVPDGYQRTELWNFHPANDPIHPAIFPVELAQEVIRNYSFEDDVVLDPFGGIGTTAEAAVRLGRRFIMVDLDQDPDKKKERSYIDTMWERAESKWGANKEDIDLHLSWDTVGTPDAGNMPSGDDLLNGMKDRYTRPDSS